MKKIVIDDVIITYEDHEDPNDVIRRYIVEEIQNQKLELERLEQELKRRKSTIERLEAIWGSKK